MGGEEAREWNEGQKREGVGFDGRWKDEVDVLRDERRICEKSRETYVQLWPTFPIVSDAIQAALLAPLPHDGVCLTGLPDSLSKMPQVLGLGQKSSPRNPF